MKKTLSSRIYLWLFLFVFFILILSWFWPVSSSTVSVPDRLQGPSFSHWLGTDQLGRDLLARMLEGASYTIGFSLLAIVLSVALGVPAGVLAGMKGGWMDRLFTRIGDSFLAFPDFLLALLLSAVLGPGLFNVVIAVVLVKWIQYSYLVRGITREVTQGQAVLLSIINGSSTGAIIKAHVVPAIRSHILVMATTDVGKVMLLIASLSYIGLGAQPPLPEWGAMLNESRAYFAGSPRLLLIPGAAVVGTALLFQSAGDKWRDSFLKEETEAREEKKHVENR
ncbi:ABC transporter permease [Sinobaca sp. H24]|uniref:ABC transporter permease n=1 Tax=Sinobaca sp. H24 TaxID=2923376 RepID=UPI0020792426|nr:ABC transporter permease subunit [Sinobaca sp. H24]